MKYKMFKIREEKQGGKEKQRTNVMNRKQL